MKKTLLLLLAIIAVTAGSFAATYTITVANFSFSPASIVTVHTGDTVKWVWSSGSHTTTSTTIPSGAASWDAPMTSTSTTFIYVPTVTGTYNYQCKPHGPSMAGSFSVISGTGGGTLPMGVVHDIEVEDNEFDPSSLSVNVGDTIRWYWDEGSHTTTSTNIPAGAASWNSPINSSAREFRYVVTQPGTYHYQCQIHGAMMSGRFTATGTGSSTGIGMVSGVPSLLLYPNPAVNSIHLDLSAITGMVHITVRDMAGRMEFTGSAGGGTSMYISTALLPNGIYILHASGNGINITNRFVVSH